MSNARIAIEDHLAPISSIASQVCPNNKKSPPRNGPIPYDDKVMHKYRRSPESKERNQQKNAGARRICQCCYPA